jgi:hypothetical protein
MISVRADSVGQVFKAIRLGFRKVIDNQKFYDPLDFTTENRRHK